MIIVIFKSLWKDRTFKAIVLSVVLILIMGSIRPNKSIGMNSIRYEYEKRQWKHCGDMVLAGDSRVLMALSPGEMQKKLKDIRIFNYSYAGVWYSRQYLHAVENVLDPNSNMKVIVLGISPRSLTEGVRDNPGAFANTSNSLDRDDIIRYFFAPLIQFCQPMSFDQILPGIFPSLASSILIKEYHPDGWMSADCTINKRGKWAVNRYRRIYEQYDVLESTIQNIIHYTENWANKGIKVYGFFAPACEEMVAIEANLPSFDQTEFIKRFVENGGIWLDINQTGYESYDGCHLQNDGALRFSNDFAGLIK